MEETDDEYASVRGDTVETDGIFSDSEPEEGAPSGYKIHSEYGPFQPKDIPELEQDDPYFNFSGMSAEDFDRFLELQYGNAQFLEKDNNQEDTDDQKDRILKSRSDICIQDLSSFAWCDLTNRHKIPRAADVEIRRFHSAITDPDSDVITPSEIRTALDRLLNLTGLRAKIHGRCENNCYAFRDDDDHTESCPVCHKARFKYTRDGKERVNAANYWTIPIIPRILAWYMDPYKAELMTTYPAEAAKSYENEIIADFWSGRLYHTILKKDKGLFKELTDLAFYFSTDEYRAISIRARYGVWPMILLCYNLPTEIRFKNWNTLTYGLIPGPDMPDRVDTFMYPLIAEFKILEKGIDAYNAYRRYEKFTLRAYVVVIGADMMARMKLMRVLGNRAKSYCEYCLITGLWQKDHGKQFYSHLCIRIRLKRNRCQMRPPRSYRSAPKCCRA